MAMHLWAATHRSSRLHGDHSDSRKVFGYGISLVTWMVAGSVFVAVKLVADEMPPWTMVFWRAFIAGLVLLPFVYRDLLQSIDIIRVRWLALLLIGGLGLGLTQGALFSALHMTTAMNVGIIMGLAPMLVLVLAAIMLKEPINGWQGLGTLIAFCGVVFIAVKGSMANLIAFQISLGDLVALIAAILFAIYTVFLKWARFDLDALPLLTILLFSGSCAALPFYMAEFIQGQQAKLTIEGYLALFYCAILGGSLIYVLYYLSVEILGAGRAGSLVYTQTLFCAFFAWLVLGETLVWYHLAGGAAVAIGILFVLALGPREDLYQPDE